MRRGQFLASIAVAGLTAAGCSGGDPAVRTRSIDLGPLRIDQIYRSMDGPFARTRFDISDIDWVTGFRTEVYDVGTGERLGDEFICHSQLQVDN